MTAGKVERTEEALPVLRRLSGACIPGIRKRVLADQLAFSDVLELWKGIVRGAAP